MARRMGLAINTFCPITQNVSYRFQERSKERANMDEMKRKQLWYAASSESRCKYERENN